ncbi:MAG: hypothetical protein FH762_01300 [Firmicutes bacterium]|nr:hypothetical protein [Bacillota bacterium]
MYEIFACLCSSNCSKTKLSKIPSIIKKGVVFLKIGRFVVDGHIHCGKKDSAKDDSKLKGVQAEVEAVDNSDMALYDMEAYGVDMGILLPSFTGTTNELYANIAKKHPDRFRTCAVDTQTRLDAARGVKKWTLDAALKELDECFTKEPNVFVGVGEFAPGAMGVVRDRPTRLERFKEWCQIAELCVHHDVPCFFHEYSSINLDDPFTMLANVCSKYPTFKVIIAHGGGQKPYEIEKACFLAGLYEHIYLETGYWRAEYYEFALRDNLVGASKLIWGGGDTGSRLWYPQINPGAVLTEKTRVYNNRNNWVWNGKREVDYQPDYYGWSTHQIHRLKDMDLCTQDEINLIVGGNAVRLYKLPLPEAVTFCAGRPDLNIPPREIFESKEVTERAAYAWNKGTDAEIDYIPGTQSFNA